MWGEPGASSEILIEAVRTPFPKGEKVTLVEQFALIARAPLHDVAAIRKSAVLAPLIAIEVMCNVAAP